MSKASSARARKSSQVSSGWARPGGWARPIYINRHPQPPAKCIGFSEISQSLYTRVKIRLTASGLWDIVGSCPRLILSRCNKFVKVSTGPGADET